MLPGAWHDEAVRARGVAIATAHIDHAHFVPRILGHDERHPIRNSAYRGRYVSTSLLVAPTRETPRYLPVLLLLLLRDHGNLSRPCSEPHLRFCSLVALPESALATFRMQ